MTAPDSAPPDDVDDLVEDGVISRWSDEGIAHACRVYEHARHEAERAHARCVRTMAILGARVWREGHPLDREKLYQRRVWRYRARVCFEHLTQALAEWAPQGRGH
jgi:hypothetical protein